ncbi:fimbria/pilus outer membrane usher protein [Stenotrophomonas sp. HMWF023]|uniref:fimbria/pilus outer membrane usher protein n=1 Tax=Stenotrophomonas sp. HMWF023 TaxID=2056859 RepID=UPI0015E86D17|nr:fimbria/pilus outer membrane usher protein [Stenotrophomonas sp. HMWF023]
MRIQTYSPSVRARPAPAALSIAIAGALLAPWTAIAGTSASAEEVSFNQAFLDSSTRQTVSRFERGASLPAGEYAVDVFVNKTNTGRRRLRLVEGERDVEPCLPLSMLSELGVKAATAAIEAGQSAEECADISALVAEATATLNSSSLQLMLSVPQAALDRSPRGYVDPSQWDDGVTAGTFAYSLNSYRRDNPTSGSQLSTSLRMSSGLSLGAWRFRHDANYNWRQGDGGHLQTMSAYARRDLTKLKARLTVGRTNTTGELFDSLAFDGVQVSSDPRMLPDSMNGFAPVVRGVARTNANVVIRQSGYVVYEAAVAPGPFEITDLYASGFAGDLEVTVMESDGSSNRFVVPYASVPRLLRPGQARYSATAGQLRNVGYGDVTSQVRFVEGTYQRGLNNVVTGFGGVQATDDGNYLSAMAGTALNTRLGAISADVTFSSAQLPGDASRRSGHSVRATYSKSLPTTGTSVAVAAYRYSSEGYLSLRDAAALSAVDDDFFGPGISPARQQRKNTLQLNVTQTLANGYGTIYASGSSSTYWNRSGRDTTFQFGYSNRLGSGNYSISASRTRDAFGRADNQINLSYSIPLWRESRAPRVDLRFDRRESGDSWSAGLAGQAGDRGQFNYNASVSDGETQSASWSLGAGYNAPYASMSASTSQSGQSSAQSFGMSGGLVVHRGGVTLAPSLSETIAIVEAQGAEGARVGTFGKVDSRGYAVVNSLRPYRKNTVTLDPTTATELIELETNRLDAVPRAGAVAWLKFEGGQNRMELISVRDEAGAKLPFGAEVFDESGALVGQVAQGSLIYVQTSAPGSMLTVRWGDAKMNSCVLSMQKDQPMNTSSNQNELRCLSTSKDGQQ